MERQRIVVFSGAGVSAESGLRTFRDADGLWEEHPIEEVATPQAWHRDPRKVLHFYDMRREQVIAAVPNADHQRELGERLQSFRLIIFCEPLRSSLPLFLSKLSNPFLGEVTRHDMPVSIRAGFRPGELPALLGLDSKKWILRELSHWRGSLRLVASRR
jgi:hypothetical protein